MEDFLEGLRSFDPGVPDASEVIATHLLLPDRTGEKQSKEARQLISRAQTGEGNSFYGKKHTKETRNKMSESQSKVDRNGENNPMTKHTPEAKEKMRLAWERRRAIIREKASTSK